MTSFSSAPAGARCSRKRYFIPIMPASSIGASSPDAIVTTGGASIPTSQPTPRRTAPRWLPQTGSRRPAPGERGPTPGATASLKRPSGRRKPNTVRKTRPPRRKASSALASSARLPGCTRAITIGTGSSSPGTLAQKTISSPSSGFTDWRRSAICLNSCPVSEFHQAPNVAFWADCSSARARARPIVRPDSEPCRRRPRGKIREQSRVGPQLGGKFASSRSIFTNDPSSSR